MRASVLLSALAAFGFPDAPSRGEEVAFSTIAVWGQSTSLSVEFLPAIGVQRSRTMIMMAPRRHAELSERIVAAARENPEWFQTYVAQHQNRDGMLPYHPNLGLSEEEYRQFIELMGQFRLGEVERGELSVSEGPDGALMLSAAGHASYLSGIVIDADGGYVQTAYGRLTRRTEINQSDPNSPTGRWRGVQWSNEGDQTIPIVKFAVGRRESGERVIYYDVSPSEDQTLFLLYE